MAQGVCTGRRPLSKEDQMSDPTARGSVGQLLAAHQPLEQNAAMVNALQRRAVLDAESDASTVTDPSS
jgi:hypothetical protein